ncbi:hypothetical protein PInf_005277 [Phytophthora infestans]|nr:hypothetical protein PInf_005277 [Phytophthora infestans]
MQVLEGDRAMQIEKFVDKKLGEALQKVHQSSQAITLQTDVAQKLLVDMEQTVANSQAAFASHIRQVAESELASLQHDSLESRVQSLVTNTQSEMNLQIQRQADATSVLREKLQKQQMRFKHRSIRIDEEWLKTSFQDVLLSNPDLVSPERQE